MKGMAITTVLLILLLVLAVIIVGVMASTTAQNANNYIGSTKKPPIPTLFIPDITIDSASYTYSNSEITVKMSITSNEATSTKIYVNLSSLPDTAITPTEKKVIVDQGINEISVKAPASQDSGLEVNIRLYTEDNAYITGYVIKNS